MTRMDFENLYEEVTGLAYELNCGTSGKKAYINYDPHRRKYSLLLELENRRLDGSMKLSTLLKYSDLLGTKTVYPDLEGIRFYKEMSLNNIKNLLEDLL